MRLQCAWAVLLVVLPLCLTASEAPLEGEVTLLQEEPKERVYPYRKWSLDAGALANSDDFPALPAEPKSKDPEMELEKWAMKRGMNNKYYKARGIHAVHQAKREVEDADIAREKLIAKVESESLQKAEQAELNKSTSDPSEDVGVPAPANPMAQAKANSKSQKLKMEREVAEDTAQQAKSKALELDAKQMAEAAGAANGDDLFLQLGEEPTVLVKSGSSLHRAASTRVFVKDGSSLHHSAGTSTHVKEGSSLHADAAPAKEQTQEEKQHEELASKLSAENSDPNEGTTRYYGKKDEDLHKKDPLYDTNTIPDVLQKSARNSVEQLATSVVKKSGGDALDAGYTNAVIASAVAAAAPKIARLQHQANVAAALKLRDAKATARATIESAKKNEEKEEVAAEAAQNAAQAHDAAVANQVVASAGQPTVL